MELWQRLAADAGRRLDDAQVAKLHRYLDLLLERNRVMNLTRITDRDEANVKHVADALTLLPFLPANDHTLADVGSGGGVPGIPLAIARPDAKITLIESTRKKARFLEEAASELKLDNVRVVADRAENVDETFDIVTARAVAPLDQLLKWCLPLIAPGGRLLAMKGPGVDEELTSSRLPVDWTSAVHAAGVSDHVIVEVTRHG